MLRLEPNLLSAWSERRINAHPLILNSLEGQNTDGIIGVGEILGNRREHSSSGRRGVAYCPGPLTGIVPSGHSGFMREWSSFFISRRFNGELCYRGLPNYSIFWESIGGFVSRLPVSVFRPASEGPQSHASHRFLVWLCFVNRSCRFLCGRALRRWISLPGTPK